MTQRNFNPRPLLDDPNYWNKFFTPPAAFAFCDRPPETSTLEIAEIRLLDRLLDGYAHGYDQIPSSEGGSSDGTPVYRASAPSRDGSSELIIGLRLLDWKASDPAGHIQSQDFPSLLQANFHLSRRNAFDASLALVAASLADALYSYPLEMLCQILRGECEADRTGYLGSERHLRDWINHALGRRVE